MADIPERGDFTKEGLLEFARHFPFFNLIGLEVVDLEPGWSKTRLAFRPDLTQPAGVMHGGVIASLVDTGVAHALLLTDVFQEVAQNGGGIVSVDLRIRYLRPVSSGQITCETTVPRLGRRIIHSNSVVVNDDGKEVALGDSIYMSVAPRDLTAR
ncbi:MAG: PaaI family thioesterase [Myxococcota bacterium]